MSKGKPSPLVRIRASLIHKPGSGHPDAKYWGGGREKKLSCAEELPMLFGAPQKLSSPLYVREGMLFTVRALGGFLLIPPQ